VLNNSDFFELELELELLLCFGVVVVVKFFILLVSSFLISFYYLLSSLFSGFLFLDWYKNFEIFYAFDLDFGILLYVDSYIDSLVFDNLSYLSDFLLYFSKELVFLLYLFTDYLLFYC